MKEPFSILFAILGALLFTNQPTNKGRKRASDNKIVISIRGILNSSKSTKKYTRECKTNGTMMDDEIIIPTTNGNWWLFSKTLITKGAPKPVDIPESSKTGIARDG